MPIDSDCIPHGLYILVVLQYTMPIPQHPALTIEAPILIISLRSAGLEEGRPRVAGNRDPCSQLGGSWILISRVVNRPTILITHIRGLITPLITTPKPYITLKGALKGTP